MGFKDPVGYNTHEYVSLAELSNDIFSMSESM